MRIRALSTSLANQIAAGEVIERPASVVKELLENALDAGATALVIEIGFGGFNQIKVSDNGMGICAEDLHLAIAAHATSKISQLTDLYQITTMGFRGEALASIASISRLTLYSKPADQAYAMMIRADETGIVIRACARTQGTTIDVRDLFFNAPVRKSFLKTERIEYQAIESVVKQFALSVPTVAITLSHNGKQTLLLQASSSLEGRVRRIKKLFGQAFLDDATYLDECHDELMIQGWMTQRAYQRSQRDRQWVYLNHRMIKDKLIQQSIGQVYQGILYPGRYPACILYLSIAPDQVDVNVHPTKYEVRFRQPRLIHDRLVRVLSASLQRTEAPSIVEPETIGTPSVGEHLQEIILPRWSILNARFAMIFWDTGAVYLANIQAIYHLYLKQRLGDMSVSLGPRPLLVPIHMTVDTTAQAALVRYQPLLWKLGLKFEWLHETELSVQSIPIDLPLLDLKQFFKAIQTERWDEKELWMRMIECQSFNAYHLNALEWESLMHYCVLHWDASDLKGHYTCLDEAGCQKMMVTDHA